MNDWNLLKQTFHRGLTLDQAGRRHLTASLDAETRAELGSLWKHAEAQAFNFDGLSNQVLDLLLEERTLPARVGPYRILKSLEGGRMGAVYLAEQDAPLSRKVVVKMLPSGVSDEEPMQRFLRATRC